MKNIVLLAVSIFVASFAGAMDLRKLNIGSEAALRHYLATNTTYISANAYQVDGEGRQVGLGSYGVNKKFPDYQALEAGFRNLLREATNGASAWSGFDPNRPVLLYAVAAREEVIRTGGTLEGFTRFNFFANNLNGETVGEMLIQFARGGLSLKFYGARKQIVQVRLEVLDRNRFDPNFVGPLFYRYKDTSKDPTQDFVYLDYSPYGDALFEEQYLINGGPGGPWDVYIEFTLDDGSVHHFDGAGNPTSPMRLFIYPDGTLEVLGALPGDEVVIQTANSLGGPWSPEPEKNIVASGEAPAQSAPPAVGRSDGPPSEPPVKLYRIQ